MVEFTFPNPDPRIKECSKDVNLYMASMMAKLNIIPHLVATLVERWRQKTLTFHFPCRKKTITLKVITFITNLPINRDVVIVDSAIGPTFKYGQFLCVLPSREQPEKDLDGIAHG